MRLISGDEMVNGAQIIKADDPTGRLDSKQGPAVIKHMHDCVKNDESAVMKASHIEKILKYAHGIYHPKDGKL